jgi:predicted esterase
VVLVGFSQGACLALEWFSRTPDRVGGVIAFTGGLLGPPGTPWPTSAIAHTPVLLSTSDIDEWVPLARVRETAAALAERGARVTLNERPGRPHVVDDFEIAAARVLLARALI